MMRRFVVIGLLLLLAGTAFSQADSVDGILKAMMAGRADIQALRGSFIMVNTSPPDEPIESTGEILFVQPRRIVFRITDPMEDGLDSVILVDDEKLFEYDPVLEQLQVYERRSDIQMEALFAAFDNDLDQLNQAYEVTQFDPGDQAERAVAGLVLRPKVIEEGARPLFERMRLYLREGDYLPVRIQIVNEPGSETTLDFKTLEVNPIVAPEETQIRLPAGTKIIENETDFRTTEDTTYVPAPIVVAPSEEPDPTLFEAEP